MADVTTLSLVELGVLGPLQVRKGGAPVVIPGAKPRAILTMLGLHRGSVVSSDALLALLWGDDPPRTAEKALQTHVSTLRRTLGDGVVVTAGTGWTLAGAEVDASRYKLAAKDGRDAAAAGDTSQALGRFEEALALWRGIPELPDSQRGTSEKTRWIEDHAALVEDRTDGLLTTGRAAEIIGELEAAVGDAPLRERRWGQLMLALYRAGRQGEALGAYQRARSLLADELGVDPGPDLRRLESAIVAQDPSLDAPVAQDLPVVTRTVTFLLTDIEGSTAAWEADSDAMAVALARHDELVEQVITSRGGRLIKTRGEGDATFSVFERPSAAAAAALELQDAITHEPWPLQEAMRIRVALHTGEAELRGGDYFGRAVNRAARLRSLAAGGQILCSGATGELVIDSLPDDVVLADLGLRQLRNLARPEHVFELRLDAADDRSQELTTDAPMERPALPPVLAGPGPFVGRRHELEGLLAAWQTTLAAGSHAVLIAGEPGVGKTRLAGEWSRQAYEQGGAVIYGRCDEDLGAPYQPFVEALRSLVSCLGGRRLRGIRGVESLLPLVPELSEDLPDLAGSTRSDPDTERYALFDAVVALLGVASTSTPIVLVLDDLHWAAKPTLLLLRHLLRFGEHARVQIVGTYRSTDLDRSHPLAAMLADLHRDGTANRIQLSGLDEDDVTAYVTEAGYDDDELARALASVTGGNPFFLIEALRHVDESGGHWDPSTLPQGVREAVSRRLSRLPAETNKALAAAAVVGSRFALELVEQVVGQDLVDAFDEACKAGIVIEEPGGRYRFNHAIVRQSLLAELASVRRMRLHQRIAMTLENAPGADDELLAELAYHYFECAWAGNAAKAVEYCRRAADQAMTRLSYEGAADLYDHALHALEEIDEELPDRDDQAADLLIARCEALLAAGDVASAEGVVSALHEATRDSGRLGAWATCFGGQLSMLIHPEQLDEVEVALGAAADKLSELGDAAGEAKAHTVRAGCLARLGRVGDCETALDDALTAARRAHDHRRVNAVLAGAPLAALWGPNPVPRAGGRCLDVVRLLRITTDSPAVEATSTRCQSVLEAFRGRAAAARRMIDSARRTVTELGLRHALLEVEQFAGIVELVVDETAAAEPHLRKAYNGFRRMGLDADTAETAALLGRTCLALGRIAEADELCSESERLAGHALKPSIAWRTLRAQLLSRGHDHDEARRVAEEAVALAERTDGLVDHGDACLALATVLDAGGDQTGARAAAERAVDLYERKGAAALAEKARGILVGHDHLPALPPAEEPSVELDNACVRTGKQLLTAVEREAWDEVERFFATEVSVESRRKIVGFTRFNLPSREWPHEMRRYLEAGMVRHDHAFVAVRGERLALVRLVVGTGDVSPGAPQDEMLQLIGMDEDGRIALQVWFDVEDIDAAIAELDAEHARFEEQHRRATLENEASRITERFWTCFAANDSDAMARLLADDFFNDDRRHAVNSGMRRGRDAVIVDMRVSAEFGAHITSKVIATRGERLCLSRTCFAGQDHRPDAFVIEILHVIEIDADERIAALVAFDLDDFDAAIAELDARYLAGEAAAHAHTWSIITGTYASIGRHEFPALTPDCATIDHRRATAFAPGDLPAYIRAGWDMGQDVRAYVEVVHQLSNLGAVCSCAAHGVSREGFDAEWRHLALSIVQGDMVNRCEFFDEADLEAATERFAQLGRPTPRLENAASRVGERYQACFAARDWSAMAELVADEIVNDDRRHVVNAGFRQGRETHMADTQAAAHVGAVNARSSFIATRGERLALARVRTWNRGFSADEFSSEVLGIIEIDTDNRAIALVLFDLDDIDAAFAELEARYIAGEAAPYAHAWSVIARAYAGFNQGQLPATTHESVTVDHRGATAFSPGDGMENLRAAWDLTPDVRIRIEAVHRLSDRGAVFTHTANGTSREGFEAEWRAIDIMMVEGEVIDHGEIFDEADLDAALAKFDQLSRSAPRLANAASRVAEGFATHFAAHDLGAVAHTLANDISTDDRRRVVGAGPRHGRDAVMAELSAVIEIGVKSAISDTIATRGERLVLSRARTWGHDQRPDAFLTEMLSIIETNGDERIVALVTFDPDDFEGAITELDNRYLAGEAAPSAHTWSVVTGAYAALNRHEFPATTGDWVNVDHRGETAFGAGELSAYFQAGLDLDQDISIYLEAVHQLTDRGAVVTYAARETSKYGFDAEWRGVAMLMLDGDMVKRCEVFNEAEIATAVAVFGQLSRPTPQLENAASRMADRVMAYFTAREWDPAAAMVADDFSSDDRRRTVNAGVRRGAGAAMEDAHANADLGAKEVTSTVIATRGERLVLRRARYAAGAQRLEAFYVDALNVYEINGDGRLAAVVTFDIDDLDAALEELETRYLAGEAAPYARTWSVIARSNAALNRREIIEATPDWVNIDHRRVTAFAPGDLIGYIRAGWDVDQPISYIEAVHRLDELGAVVTHVAHGSSREGFDAEWRVVTLGTLEGELCNRCEIFDESDLGAALARFEELHSQVRRLENAASKLTERYWKCFADRDWDAMAELLAEGISTDDRRQVVGAGVRCGRDAEIAEVQTTAKLGTKHVTPVVIAVRGRQLALMRIVFSGRDERPDAFHSEILAIVEINTDNLMTARIVFDADDREAAFAELDARYIAGEAAPYGRTWSAVTGVYAAFNRHELPERIPDWILVDHRQVVTIAPDDYVETVRAALDLTPDMRIHMESVLRLNDRGAVVVHVAQGTTPEGFAAEWRMVLIYRVDGDCELFDMADLDAALTAFDERARTLRRENAATRAWAGVVDAANQHDVEGFLAHAGADARYEDRRKVLHDEGPSRPEVIRALFEMTTGWRLESEPVAIRGSRLGLTRDSYRDMTDVTQPITMEHLTLLEVGDDNLGRYLALFDTDDLEAGFAELDARYTTGEAAAHAHTWSVITAGYAALNHHEIPPTTPDWVNIDHRRVTPFAPGDQIPYIRASWEDTPDLAIYIEAVLRLNDRGAVFTSATHGTSREGFDAEWRAIGIITIEGDLIDRCELFDEIDIDAALARFEELSLG